MVADATPTTLQTHSASVHVSIPAGRPNWGRIGLHVAAGTIALIMAFPLLWMLITALKPASQVFDGAWIPRETTLDNFRVAFSAKPVGTWLMNSVLTSAGITLLRVGLAIFAAYALGRMRSRWNHIWLGLLVGTMLIPGVVTLIPNYLTVARLHWLNTLIGVIVPQAASSAFFVFLLRQYVKQIPQDLFDAMELDGAGIFQRLKDLVIPLILPGILAAAALSFLWGWNSYLWPLLILPATESQTIAIGLGSFASDPEGPQLWGPLMATALVSSIPPLVIFLIAQKQLTSALTSGMKG